MSPLHSAQAAAGTASHILKIEGLSFHYPPRALFTDWSICIAPGVTAVRGDESSGKTTLLRLMAGDLPVQAGRLRINSSDLLRDPVAYRAQVFWADPRSTALDQVTPVDYFKSLPPRYAFFDPKMLDELVDRFSLLEHQHKPMYMLSTGSKRKVWLAAAFSSGAPVTLLDEPFAALDKASILVVKTLLNNAAAHPARAWVLADYEAPDDVTLAATIDLDSQ